MRWLIAYGFSSIGKKQFSALTGFLLVGFLAGHLSGNLLLLKSGEAFDRYAEFLMAHPMLPLAEAGLAALFLAHIAVGLLLWFQNMGARPVPYGVSKAAGGRTLGSSTMPYTGLLILVFVSAHVLTLRVLHAVQSPESSLFEWVMGYFRMPLTVALYVAACAVLGLHLSHGLGSVFQTYGLRHSKLTPAIEFGGFGAAAAFGFGFGMLPVLGYLGYLK